ncbi:hypothetical protein HELRODRAFT_164935 [Helobdella robusta]|uniref:Uncharacterized protein n=1 Tax=Helobdella robusta TaxID=6412 RepID=T1EVZ6_HELRO|nr:hypothetical protein HELRODRAFT_164935 [Helobdella robusta]ESN92812.1 hypothetical protein HELRODRAFT_164935 [Helobdella robusta]
MEKLEVIKLLNVSIKGYSFPLLPVFTCFNCDKEFRLRVMLHAHQKECCSKFNSCEDLDHRHSSSNKREYFSMLGLKSVNVNSKHSKSDDSTNFFCGDIIVIDDEDEDEDDEIELPVSNNSLSKYQNPVATDEKLDSKNHVKSFLKVHLRNRYQKLLALDVTSPLGRRIDFKTSFKGKKQTCIMNGFPSYETWCLTILNEQKHSDSKYLKITKDPMVRKYNFRQKKQIKKLSKTAEELKLKMKLCSVSINRITTEVSPSYNSNKENKTFKDCPSSSEDQEPVIRKVYSLALNNSNDSLNQGSINNVNETEENLINLCDVDNDCFVCEVEPSNNKNLLAGRIEASPKSPQTFSFLCRICDNVVECNSGSQENMRQHYAYVHNIFNVNLVPCVLNGKTIWKLVETYNPLIKKLCFKGTNNKNTESLNTLPSRTGILPSHTVQCGKSSSNSHFQSRTMLSTNSFSESFNRKNFLSSKSLNYQTFSTDIICID